MAGRGTDIKLGEGVKSLAALQSSVRNATNPAGLTISSADVQDVRETRASHNFIFQWKMN